MTEEDDRRIEFERRLNRDWGPDISPWRRRLFGLFIIAAFVGLIVGAILTTQH
jgi:hypothetical protein